jgi:glutamyl-tRNA reductase
VLLCLTANHRNAGFDLLDRLSTVAPGATRELVGDSDFMAGAVVLATCNRFEAYLDIDEPVTAGTALAVESTVQAMSAASGVDAAELREAVTVLHGDAVAHHLFSVSAGLESLALGEDEIAGQVRHALDRARVDGTTTSNLERLFQRATATSREVRATTSLGGAGRSLVRLALELASSRVTDWAHARVLVVGTGQYARTTIVNLRDMGARDVRVYSATGRAEQFALKYGLTAVADLRDAVADADVVITCTARYTVSPEHVANDARRLVIDLGMPRNVDPAVAAMPGVELLDLEIIAMHAPLPELSPSGAREMVGHAAHAFTSEQDVTPAVVALRKHVFDALDAEIARATKRGGDEKTVEALRHLAGVILHTPSVRAKELARTGRADEFVDGLEALFGIVPEAHVAPVLGTSDTDDLAQNDRSTGGTLSA